MALNSWTKLNDIRFLRGSLYTHHICLFLLHHFVFKCNASFSLSQNIRFRTVELSILWYFSKAISLKSPKTRRLQLRLHKLRLFFSLSLVLFNNVFNGTRSHLTFGLCTNLLLLSTHDKFERIQNFIVLSLTLLINEANRTAISNNFRYKIFKHLDAHMRRDWYDKCMCHLQLFTLKHTFPHYKRFTLF